MCLHFIHIYLYYFVLIPIQHPSRGLLGPYTFDSKTCFSKKHHRFTNVIRASTSLPAFQRRLLWAPPKIQLRRRPDDNMNERPRVPLVDRWGDLDPQRCVPANSLAPMEMKVMGDQITDVAPLARAAHLWPAGPWPSKTPYKATRPAECMVPGTRNLWWFAKHNGAVIVLCNHPRSSFIMTHDL